MGRNLAGRAVLFLVSALSITACGDARDASESNFRKALADIRPEESCIHIGRGSMNQLERTNVNGGVYDGFPIIQLFVTQGLLERVEYPANAALAVFAVTNSAENIAKRFPVRFSDGYTVGFCPGTLAIDRILFTVPPDGESTTSNVTVSWSVNDIPADFAAFNANPEFDGSIVSQMAPSGETEFRLQLTNEGWKQMDLR